MEVEDRKIHGVVDRSKLQHKKHEKKAVWNQVELNATAPLAGSDDTQALLTLLSCNKKLKQIATLLLAFVIYGRAENNCSSLTV